MGPLQPRTDASTTSRRKRRKQPPPATTRLRALRNARTLGPSTQHRRRAIQPTKKHPRELRSRLKTLFVCLLQTLPPPEKGTRPLKTLPPPVLLRRLLLFFSYSRLLAHITSLLRAAGYGRRRVIGTTGRWYNSGFLCFLGTKTIRVSVLSPVLKY